MRSGYVNQACKMSLQVSTDPFRLAVEDLKREKEQQVNNLEEELRKVKEERLKDLRELIRLKKILNDGSDINKLRLENERLRLELQKYTKFESEYSRFIIELEKNRLELIDLKDSLKSYANMSDEIEKMRIENEKLSQIDFNKIHEDHEENRKLFEELNQLSQQNDVPQFIFDQIDKLETENTELKKKLEGFIKSTEISEESSFAIDENDIVSNIKARVGTIEKRLNTKHESPKHIQKPPPQRLVSINMQLQPNEPPYQVLDELGSDDWANFSDLLDSDSKIE